MLVRSSITFLITFLAICSAPIMQGQLIAYEGFQYPAVKQSPTLWPVTNKSPDGQPLKYFTEFDTHASRSPYDYTIQILNGSIPTKDSAFPFPTKGNSLSWAREWLDAYGTIDPNFQFDTSRDNAPIYVSFLLRANKSDNPVRQMALAFSNGSSQRLQIGVDDSSNTGKARFFACVASPQPIREYASASLEYDTTYFIVAKIVTSTSRKDMVYMNFYGPSSKPPETDKNMRWAVEVGDWTDFLVTNVAISLYGGEAGGLMFDELRIGSNWESVAVGAKPTAPAKSTNTDGTKAANGDASEELAGEAGGSAEKSSPIVLGLIGLGIVAFIGGGIAFYLFVLKPGKKGKPAPAKPKSMPSKPASAPPGGAPSTAPTEPEAKSSGGAKPPAPRRPKKPPPPK